MKKDNKIKHSNLLNFVFLGRDLNYSSSLASLALLSRLQYLDQCDACNTE